MISLQLNCVRSHFKENNNWPTCDYSDLIKVGTKCFMSNQKDLADGLGLKEIGKKNRMQRMMEVETRKLNYQNIQGEIAAMRLLNSKTNTYQSESAVSMHEFNTEEWQTMFDNATLTASPEKLLDHCQ